ncbi:MaoC family dehydratase [Saccharopolyspora gloriosae]|uniref:MaoC family dehydratase n=1 Tax=Saccharopolyspora gloriosae TaxID=455344 RepID=UPI001FB6EC00|nr:MaoC/PaaZ C-terminal domain-containing protein [Saccharopolyspora gloriosae]
MMSTEVDAAPNLSALYLKAAVSGPIRRGGELPETEYVRRDIAIDQAHLAEYDRVCGFGLRDVLPATYPHVLSFGLSVRLMTDPGFPFPLVGLVHVANSITVHRPVLVTDLLTQRVRVANLRPHPKGRQLDVITETSVEDEVVWSETSTYLRRGKSDDSAPRAERAAEIEAGSPAAFWRVPADQGRRYAAVSGDRNPIHLRALTAKAFGFPRAIAHGMWTKARALAALEGRLPESYTVDVDFVKPLLLPSKVEFTELGDPRVGATFAVHSRSGKPHLLGRVH